MQSNKLLFILISILSLYTPQAFTQTLQLAPAPLSHCTLTQHDDDTYEITTTGSDPFLYTQPLPEGINLTTNHILAFEYFSLTGIGDTQIFLSPPTQEKFSVHGEGLPKSEGWSKYSVDLKPALEKWGQPVAKFRIDFGMHSKRTIQIRHLQLRPKSQQERALEARIAARKEIEAKQTQKIRNYLDKNYPCTIPKITVDEESIYIEDDMNLNGKNIHLAEIPLHADSSDPMQSAKIHPFRMKDLKTLGLELARFNPETKQDRLLSRWIMVEKVDDKYIPRSHARYVDTVASINTYPEEKPHNRKGLGAFSQGRPLSDIKDLDISAVTVNILLHQYLRTAPADGYTPREYSGRTFYVNESALARLDQNLADAAKRKLIVSAILLIPQAGNAKPGEFRRLIAHPDADPAGIYVMPNLTSQEGVTAYAAVLDLLAERYGRPDKKYGRIHHWIIHNEVNSGWVWTNMGEKSAATYMDAYHKSMRMTHLIARQYNPHARTFISLEHNWTSTHNDKCHTGRELLDLLIDFSNAEGDFEWSLAYHPYPQNLGNPRTWEDQDATFSFDTPLITFKNIEVIDAWMRQPKALYQGKHLRDIQFTEQAPNSPDYSSTSLTEQAAAMAYVWKKMEPLDSITMFHVHNWVDNRHEGGLRIGLRKYPSDKEDPHGKKPIWYTFQSFGTPEEDKHIEKYKKVIGIQDWDEVIYKNNITPEGN